MTIDDTNVAASRGEVRIDSDGTLWTRATAAWKQYPQTQYYRTIVTKQSIPAPQSIAATRGMVYLVPFEVPQKLTIQKVFHSPASANGVIRFAVYSDNGDTPVGGSKVFDSGNVTGAITPSGATVSYSANPGQYWLAITSASNNFSFARTNNQISTPFQSATFSYRAGSLASNTISLPSVCPAVSMPVSGAIVVSVITVT